MLAHPSLSLSFTLPSHSFTLPLSVCLSVSLSLPLSPSLSQMAMVSVWYLQCLVFMSSSVSLGDLLHLIDNSSHVSTLPHSFPPLSSLPPFPSLLPLLSSFPPSLSLFPPSSLPPLSLLPPSLPPSILPGRQSRADNRECDSLQSSETAPQDSGMGTVHLRLGIILRHFDKFGVEFT